MKLELKVITRKVIPRSANQILTGKYALIALELSDEVSIWICLSMSSICWGVPVQFHCYLYNVISIKYIECNWLRILIKLCCMPIHFFATYFVKMLTEGFERWCCLFQKLPFKSIRFGSNQWHLYLSGLHPYGFHVSRDFRVEWNKALALVRLWNNYRKGIGLNNFFWSCQFCSFDQIAELLSDFCFNSVEWDWGEIQSNYVTSETTSRFVFKKLIFCGFFSFQVYPKAERSRISLAWFLSCFQKISRSIPPQNFGFKFQLQFYKVNAGCNLAG